ncbi:hypothetical protein SLS56_000859 [Neofusicoccum ribis]|uniref:Beta-lactamase-related domain-containing protein n=1 Tax=Neofusicoccum ribis TaxID=45134 RepID=A0ABR3TCF8_9PEZI
MESFEKSIESYFQDQDRPLPRVTLGAINKAGTFSYVKSFGGQSGTPDADVPDTSDVYWIASCSKLITTIVALQCVEKGLLNLDDDISGILPEWKDPKILAHDFPTLLVAPPGTRWRYSPSLDWAGQIIERVNPGLKLGDLIRRDILAPLHLPTTALTFHLPPAAASSSPPRLARAWERRASGSLRPLAPQAVMPDPVADDFGGRGLYATAGAWLAVARALVAGGAPLLRPGTAAGMFAAQMGDAVAEGLAEEWIDPEKGVAGVYLSQLMPTGDSKSVELLGKFEEAVYAAVGQS